MLVTSHYTLGKEVKSTFLKKKMLNFLKDEENTLTFVILSNTQLKENCH